MSALHPALPRHALPVPALRIALLGARGDEPAAELGRRIAQHGHEVAIHTGSTAAGLARCLARRADVAILPAREAAAIPLLRARGTAVAVLLTGGGATGRRAGLTTTERFALREADAVVTDLELVADEVGRTGIPVELIRPGTDRPPLFPPDTAEVAAAGLVPSAYHLAVGAAGVATLIRAHRASEAQLPLVLLGADVPPALAGSRRLHVLRGPVDDVRAAALRAHALTSLHAQTSAGSAPSLLAAMAAGSAILASDTAANRELAGTAGFYAADESTFARHMHDAERYPQRFRDIGELMAERAAARHDWDRTAESWEALASRLSRGYSSRGLGPHLRSARTA